MKVLLTFLVLIFSLQSWTKADDIKDFQIEGFSIGDTLLRYYNENEIQSMAKPILIGNKKYYEYRQIYIKNKSETYDNIALYFKNDDKNYIIKKMAARNYYKDNIKECYDLQINIINEISNLAKNAKQTPLRKNKTPNFPNGKSYQTTVFFDFDDDSFIGIWCIDWSNTDTNEGDRLSIAVTTKEYRSWLNAIK